MPVILRIDVDNPFGWNQKKRLILNYISLNWTTIFNRVRLGYLSYAHELIEYLKLNEITAIWFFTLRTLPDKTFLKKIKETNQEIALHTVRSGTLEQFKLEVHKINSHISDQIRGFSKHGSGLQKLSRHHTPDYDDDKFITYAQETKLDYFIGNSETPSFLKKKGSLQYWTGCFWVNPERRDVKSFDLEWLKLTSKNETIVLIIHPLFWKFNKEVRSNLEWVIKNIPDIKRPD